MRIPSGKIDQNIYFVALDATDHVTRETGLTGFTVYRSRNGVAEVIYTTPTVVEIDATNMPGVYALLIDEDTTIASTSDSEEYCVHITKTGMAPVTRTIELYRRAVTSGATLTVSSGIAQADAVLVDGATPSDAGDIAGAIWDEDATTHQTQGTFGQAIGDPVADTDTIFGLLNTNLNATISSRASQTSVDTVDDFLDTEITDIRNRLPTALISGRMDVSVGAMAANVMTAAAAATDLGAEFAAAVLAADVEVGRTVKEHMRLEGAVIYGNATGLTGATPVFTNGGVNRVSASIVAGARTNTLDDTGA